MPSLSTTQIVAHSPDALYRLVLDVESYPQFLPFCRQTTVLRRQVSPEKTCLTVQMEVGFAAFRERYISEIIGDNEKRVIRISSLDGPFRFMRGIWTFNAKGGASAEICFQIEYEFKSRLLGLTAGKVFDKVFRAMSKAFQERADRVLGTH